MIGSRTKMWILLLIAWLSVSGGVEGQERIQRDSSFTAPTSGWFLTDTQFLQMSAAVDSLDMYLGYTPMVEQQSEKWKQMFLETDSLYEDLREEVRLESDVSLSDKMFWGVVGAGLATTLERILSDG